MKFSAAYLSSYHGLIYTRTCPSVEFSAPERVSCGRYGPRHRDKSGHLAETFIPLNVSSYLGCPSDSSFYSFCLLTGSGDDFLECVFQCENFVCSLRDLYKSVNNRSNQLLAQLLSPLPLLFAIVLLFYIFSLARNTPETRSAHDLCLLSSLICSFLSLYSAPSFLVHSHSLP